MVWVHRCFREQEDVRFVEVKNSDQVGERRAIVFSFLVVECEDRDIRGGWGHRWMEEVVVKSLWCRVLGPARVYIGIVGVPPRCLGGGVLCDRICRGGCDNERGGCLSRCGGGGGGVFEKVVRGGRGVEPNSIVRVGFTTVVVEVIGLGG